MSVATLARTQVKVLRSNYAKDSAGGMVKSRSLVMTVRARVQPAMGSRSGGGFTGTRVQSSRETETVTHLVYVPGRPDIRAKDRLEVVTTPGPLLLDILAVGDVDTLGRFLTIECKQVEYHQRGRN